jgi:hypothetical protein
MDMGCNDKCVLSDGQKKTQGKRPFLILYITVRLKLTLKQQGHRMLTEFVWLRIVTSD